MSQNHISTLGFEKATLYHGDDKDKRVDKNGTYLQHQWFITPYLDTKLGLRNENVAIYVGNSQTSGIPNRGEWIRREWNQLVPRSDSKLKFYVKNVFDEVYYDARGYPSTDRTFGVVWSFRIRGPLGLVFTSAGFHPTVSICRLDSGSKASSARNGGVGWPTL